MTILCIAILLAASSDLSAVGVVVATSAGRSSAVLASGGHTRVVTVGEKAFGARLVKVTADSVVLEIDGAMTELRVASATPRRAAARPSEFDTQVGAAAVAAPRAGAAAPEPLSFDKLEIQRRIVLEAPRILAETSATPYYQDGQVMGVSLTRVAEGTVITDAGLRAGDVLVRLNGTQIDGVPALIGLWGRLQSESQLRAEILRGGEPVTLAVNLR